jgi:hypothetical protein
MPGSTTISPVEPPRDPSLAQPTMPGRAMVKVTRKTKDVHTLLLIGPLSYYAWNGMLGAIAIPTLALWLLPGYDSPPQAFRRCD